MKILFMCVANSARSQIAEGLARKMFPDAEIKSAGSNPGKLNPYCVAVMQEAGIDISRHYSKSFNELDPGFLATLDYIITLCAEEVCPILVTRANKLHWPIPDPATRENLTEALIMTRFRVARDSLTEKLKNFKTELEK